MAYNIFVNDKHLRSENNILFNKVYFDRTSIRLNTTKTFFIVSDVAVDIDVQLSTSKEFKLFVVNSNFIEHVEQINNVNANYNIQDTKHIYKASVVFNSNISGDFSDTINILVDGEETTIALSCESIEQDPKLIELTQNFKFFITNEYETAMYSSNYREELTDEIKLNDKRREFMLRLFDITGFLGSYRSLIATLDFFGYGELLTLREIWSNGETYQTTSLIATSLDRELIRLNGFHKTNELQLVYKINEFDGTYDTLGFSNYINVLYSSDEILAKLYALKRVLEKDFLPQNTIIVDIVGEHTTEGGAYITNWMNNVSYYGIELNPANDVSVKFESLDVDIQNHKVILRDQYLVGETTLYLIPDMSTSAIYENIYPIFYIEREVDDFALDEYIHKFHTSDFAMLNLMFSEGNETFKQYSIDIKRDGVTVYDSDIMYVNWTGEHADIIGFRFVGEFLVNVKLYDGYGGISIRQFTLNVSSDLNGFDCYVINDNTYDIEKDVKLMSTYHTNNIENAVPDPINSTWQFGDDIINIIDYYKETPDIRTILTTLEDFGNVNVMELDQNIYDYGYRYANIIVDMVGDTPTQGLRTLRLRMFEHNDFETVSFQFNTSDVSNLNDWYNNLITELYLAGGIFEKFTYNLGYYSVSGLVSDRLPVLQISAIEEGFTEDLFEIEVDVLSTPRVISGSDINIWLPFSGYCTFIPNNSTGDAIIKIGDVTYIEPVVVTDSITLVSELNRLSSKLDLMLNCFDESTHVNVSTDLNELLTINIPNIGVRSIIKRGDTSSHLMKDKLGFNISTGQPFYLYMNTKRTDDIDITWTVKNSITNEIIDTYHGLVYTGQIFDEGTYTVELKAGDKFDTNLVIKNGAILVRNYI